MPRRKTNLQVIENLNSDVRKVKEKSTLKMRIEDLITVDAITETQGQFFAEYKKDCKAMLLHGCAGTGKTYIALYRALEEVLQRGNPYKKNIYDSNGNIAIDFGVYGAPETFLINKDGIIMHKHVGPIDETYYDKIILPNLR